MKWLKDQNAGFRINWTKYILSNSMEYSPFEDLSVTLTVKKFAAFYGIRKFIISHNWTPSWTRWIQTTSSQPISYILILASHLYLRLLSALFPSGFPTKILFTFFFIPVRSAWPVWVYPCKQIVQRNRLTSKNVDWKTLKSETKLVFKSI
jgi:hypothetical protein